MWIQRRWVLFLCFVAALTAEICPIQAITHTIVVSLAPYKFFVDQIVGDTARTLLLVPAGASFHDYEPTPRLVIDTSQADVWFRIGESFENRIIGALRNCHPGISIVDLRERVNLMTSGQNLCSHCTHQGADLHIWLSVTEVKTQVQQIAETLERIYPEYRLEYQKRAKTLLDALDLLDREIREKLHPLKQRIIMVSHPAYGYFSRDYQLTQLPIEQEGKDPSPRQLDQILRQAKQFNIRKIYTQPQHSSKGAYLIAEHVGADVVVLDPYAENYFATLRQITDAFASQDLN